MRVSNINQIKEFLTITTLEDFLLGQLTRMEIISFLHHLCNLCVFLWRGFWNIKTILYIVIILLPATKFLHVLWIIIVVIDSCHCTELIKAPCQHTLWVHICETEWTNNRGHTFLSAVVLNSFQQSF